VTAALPRLLLAFALMLPAWSVARAVELAGVQLPETVQVNGKALRLNGFGLRTFSPLRFRIYVAALYLEHPSTDPNAIITSPETRLLAVTFVRSISANTARRSWRDGLENNCLSPCHLDPRDVAAFLAEVPAMHAGDSFSLLFTPGGATVTVNGRQLGVIPNPQFAEAMLATFLGPRAASPRLKRQLLAGQPGGVKR
jgi:hypothetical protein